MAEGNEMARRLHILIVEDNFPAAQSTGWVLEALGHSYNLAATADLAIAAAGEEVPDAILMDIGLPEKNGLDLCREMKACEGLAGTVFIAHTGYGDERTRQRAFEAGFSHFLIKPFELSALEAILDDIAATKI